MKGCYDVRGNYVTPERRMEVQAEINQAVKEGKIKPASEMPCNRCGQDKGIRHYHTDDYDNWQETLEYICWRCHMVHHSRKRAPEYVARYEAEIANGKIYPPVYRHDFNILKKDHHIT